LKSAKDNNPASSISDIDNGGRKRKRENRADQDTAQTTAPTIVAMGTRRQSKDPCTEHGIGQHGTWQYAD